MSEDKENDIKEFMTLLTEVKVSQAETNGKLDSILDMKDQMHQNTEIARSAGYKAERNENDIKEMSKDMEQKASKKEVGNIVKQRENVSKNLPSWIAIGISFIVAFLEFIKYVSN